MTSAVFFNLQKLDWLAAATNSDQIKRRQHYSTTYFFLNSPPDQDSQDIRDTTSWISVQIPEQFVAISKHSRPGNAISQHPRWTCVSCPVTPGSTTVAVSRSSLKVILSQASVRRQLLCHAKEKLRINEFRLNSNSRVTTSLDVRYEA